MTEHRIFEIFSTCLGTKAIEKGNFELDETQFSKAMEYIDEKKVDLTMTLMGINVNQLIVYMILLAIILLLILLFFLLAMQAFGINGSIGTIINSLVPVGNENNPG